MHDIQRQLETNLAAAYDRYEAHILHSGSSPEDLKAMTPITMDLMISQWAASLDIKTRHDLMKSSIDAIR